MSIKKCILYIAPVLLAGGLAAQAPLANPELNEVVATVDGKDVTRGEVQKILQTADPRLVQYYQADPQSALMQWFIMQHLGREGTDRGLDQQSPLKEQLEAIRFDLVARAVLNDERDTYPVSPEMIDQFYELHKTDYVQSKIKAIFLSFQPKVATTANSVEELQAAAQNALAATQTQRSEADAQALAADIVKQLREGADFAGMVEKYSNDATSKANQGDFGTVTATSSYPPEFRNAILALEAGQISDPIRQPTGFYIVRVEEKTVQPVRDVRGDIIQTIRQQHLDQWLQDLNTRFRPQVKDVEFFTNPAQVGGPQAAPNAFSPVPQQ